MKSVTPICIVDEGDDWFRGIWPDDVFWSYKFSSPPYLGVGRFPFVPGFFVSEVLNTPKQVMGCTYPLHGPYDTLQKAKAIAVIKMRMLK